VDFSLLEGVLVVNISWLTPKKENVNQIPVF
jgi:hypothetical protein